MKTANSSIAFVGCGSGLGVPCPEAQADGVPCEELGVDCDSCGRGYAPNVALDRGLPESERAATLKGWQPEN